MSQTFESLFPGFLKACVDLHDLLVPFAMALLVLSFAFAFWNGPLSGPELVKFLTRLFLIILLITRAHVVINDSQVMLQSFLDQHIPARPDNIAERYKEKLAEAQQAPDREDKGFFGWLLGAGLFESIVGALLTLISWAGMIVIFFVFLVQKVVLLLCWALSPVLFALFAIQPLASIAWRHALRMIGLLLYPLGLALAACISEGILDGMVQDSFLKQFGVVGSVGYGLSNLLALAVLAVWIIFSSILAPLYIQRMVSHGSGAAGAIVRAGELTANLGVPVLSQVAGWGWSRVARGTGSKPASNTPQPVPAMPVETPAPAVTSLASEFAPEAEADDPTGQRRVEEELAGLQGLS